MITRTFALTAYLRKHHIDVIHAFSGTASIYTAIAAKLAKTPVAFGGYRGIYFHKGPLKLIQKFVLEIVGQGFWPRHITLIVPLFQRGRIGLSFRASRANRGCRANRGWYASPFRPSYEDSSSAAPAPVPIA